MGFLIGLLTVLMMFDGVILVFLVLIQLPKKDAGAGLAFGAGTTDALFGAGSGTVLTKITKYAAGAFFVLAVLLSVLQMNYHSRGTSAFSAEFSKSGSTPPASLAPPAKAPGAGTAIPVQNTNAINPPLEATNRPSVAPSTNPPAGNK